jgi:hypothetical protein
MDTTGNGFQSTPRGADDYWYFTGFADATTGTAVYLKGISGTDDTDGYFRIAGTLRTCLNLDIGCHGGSTSPGWYGSTDTTPPAVANVRTNNLTNLSIQQGTAAVTLTADASDAAGAIVSGEYFFGTEGNAGEGTAMSAVDGVFEELSEPLSATVNTSAWTAAGSPYTLYVDAKDASGNWGPTTAATVQVTVTAQDSFTVGNIPGSTGNVNTGATNVLMQTVTITVTSGTVDLLTLEIEGTKGNGTGDVALDVSQVKIYNDIGGSVTGTWEAADTLIGTGFLDSSTKKVDINITDQALASGATRYLYVLYNITTGATANDEIGARLTALTKGPTDALGTTLPVPSAAQNVKTIVGDTTPPGVATLQVWFGGNPVTSIQEETTTVTLTAVATDGTSAIVAAEYFVGVQGPAGSSVTPMIATDGAFNQLTENLTSNTSAIPPQVDTSTWTAAGSPYTIYVDAKDAAGNWGPVSAASIQVTVTAKDVVTVSGTPQ